MGRKQAIPCRKTHLGATLAAALREEAERAPDQERSRRAERLAALIEHCADRETVATSAQLLGLYDQRFLAWALETVCNGRADEPLLWAAA